jgi:excisionase family DNA binding protein
VRVKLQSRGPFHTWADVPLTVSVIEACELLSVSRETLYRLVREELLPSRKVAGRRIFTKRALAEYLGETP